MGAPALRRVTWIATAILAAGAILVLASHGRRPDPGLVRFEAAGIMRQIRPEEAAQVVVSSGLREWRFERAGSGGWVTAPAAAVDPQVASRLDSGLRFLHVSAPQRVLEPAELAGIPASEFGLDPPRYSVTVRSPVSAPFRVDFGSRNPQGLAQYARVPGRDGVLLLPAFVGEQWEAAIEAR